MFRKQIHSSKWSCKTEGQAYPLTLADMDFPLYEPFKKRLVEQITNLNNLTYKDRSHQYFDALISWYQKHYHTLLKIEEFVQCPSICNLIACCILAYTEPDQKVLVFTPVYSFYMKSIQNLKRKVFACALKEVPVSKGDGGQSNLYQYEFDMNLFKAIMNKQQPKLIILCNPHNPSGMIFSLNQLTDIAQIAKKHNAYILSDQIMGDFSLFQSNKSTSYRQNFTSMVELSFDNIIVGNSISKVFNCESVQGGYGIIRCPKARQKYQKISSAVKLLTNQMSLILTPIVYSKDGENWILYINEIITANFTLLKEAVAPYRFVKLFDLHNSYLTTIEFDFRNTGSHQVSNKILAGILASYKIYFTDMQEYYFKSQSTKNVFRISIAIPTDEFEKFIVKFKECLDGLGKFFGQNNKANNISEIQKSKL